jgi:hypothetical protein
VGPSGKRLNSALDESTDELDVGQLLLGRSLKLLDFLHHRLRDLHLFFG